MSDVPGGKIYGHSFFAAPLGRSGEAAAHRPLFRPGAAVADNPNPTHRHLFGNLAGVVMQQTVLQKVTAFARLPNAFANLLATTQPECLFGKLDHQSPQESDASMR